MGGHNVLLVHRSRLGPKSAANSLLQDSGVRFEQCSKYCHRAQARVMDTRYVVVAAALFCLVKLPVSVSHWMIICTEWRTCKGSQEGAVKYRHTGFTLFPGVCEGQLSVGGDHLQLQQSQQPGL